MIIQIREGSSPPEIYEYAMIDTANPKTKKMR